jgi:hypothetical protein
VESNKCGRGGPRVPLWKGLAQAPHATTTRSLLRSSGFGLLSAFGLRVSALAPSG